MPAVRPHQPLPCVFSRSSTALREWAGRGKEIRPAAVNSLSTTRGGASALIAGSRKRLPVSVAGAPG